MPVEKLWLIFGAFVMLIELQTCRLSGQLVEVWAAASCLPNGPLALSHLPRPFIRPCGPLVILIYFLCVEL